MISKLTEYNRTHFTSSVKSNDYNDPHNAVYTALTNYPLTEGTPQCLTVVIKRNIKEHSPQLFVYRGEGINNILCN